MIADKPIVVAGIVVKGRTEIPSPLLMSKHRVVTFISTGSVILRNVLYFHRMGYRNNADLGKGVPRRHVFHDAWELLFFL
jgi:hypothetical protein